MDNLSEPGWYPNPTGAEDLRYWTGTQWSQETASLASKSRSNVGRTTIRVGCLVLILPTLIAVVSGLVSRTPMFSAAEGNGTVMIFNIFTLPIGFITIIVGKAISNRRP